MLKYRYLAIALLGGLVGAGLLLIMGHHPNDDAYITFRHSRNFAEHFALAWNINEQPDMGSSSPLYALLLGCIALLAGPLSIPLASLYLNAFLLFASAGLLYYVALEITENNLVASVTAVVLSANSYNIRIYSQGFEAAFFVFAFFLSIFLLQRRKYGTGAFLIGLLPLIRPEGIALAPAPLMIMLYRRDFKLRGLLMLGVIPACWTFVALAYYGSVFPQSVLAKRAFAEMIGIAPGGPRADSLTFAFRRQILEGFWDVLLKPVLSSNSEPGIEFLGHPGKPGNSFLSKGNQLLYAIIILFILNVFTFFKRKRLELGIYFTYCGFFPIFILYSVRIEFWYLPIWNISILLLLLTGFWNALHLLWTKLPKVWVSKHWIPMVFFALFAFAFIHKNYFVWNSGARKWDNQRGKLYVPALRDADEFERYFAYRNAADQLNNTGRLRVLTNEVGIFGFYYDGPVDDLFGLTSSRMIKLYRKGAAEGKVPSWLELADILKSPVLMGGWLSNESGEVREPLRENYTMTFRDPDYKVFEQPMLILMRKKR